MKDSERPQAVTTAEKKCAKCGACTSVCPVYRASGNEIYSARGKRHLADVFGDEQPGPVFEDIYSKCLLCGACSTVCPRKLDITEDVMEARSEFSPYYGEHGYQKFLARKVLNRPELLGAARVLGKKAADVLFGRLPAGSGLKLRLAMFTESDALAAEPTFQLPRNIENNENAMVYFPGCAASYLYPKIVESVSDLLADYGCKLQIPSGLSCCGLALMAAGDRSGAQRLARNNIQLFEQSDGPIMVSCGSCFAHLTRYPHLFEEDETWKTRAKLVCERLVEISRFIEMLQQEEPLSFAKRQSSLKVFYHDPCHMRHDLKITDEPRTLLRALPGVELLELPDGPQCCGQGGLFHLGAPELSSVIRDDLAGKILAMNPDVITTTCSGCLMQLKTAMAAAESKVPVIHLAALINQRSQEGENEWLS